MKQLIWQGDLAVCVRDADHFEGENTLNSHRKRTKPAGQTPQIGHLDSLTGILKEMNNVYREMRLGQTAMADGTKLIFALRCMRDVLETLMLQELDARLVRLEQPALSQSQDQPETTLQ